MALTPADIHNTEFAKASLSRRGYDENDVDVLLDEATGEMIRLLEENDALRCRLEAGDQDGRRQAAQAELSAATAALDRARRACGRAERDARHVRQQLDEAHRATAAATVRGEASPERVLLMAQRTADKYVREAQGESRMLLTDARGRADRTLRDARDTAAAVHRRSHDHQNEAAARLATDRAGVVRDIDALTRFAAEYHRALEDHMHRQGRIIDGTASR
ncbi:DivIVA domain-containing protein [Actinoplanes sp. NPDC049596]|uniref:DivIVA domain-containing protein n=1 Tax=unclassified Actinoplanes TaxID=2626549 RepID=UPI0034461CEF